MRASLVRAELDICVSRCPDRDLVCAEEFSIYLNYVRKLGFEETPDYDFLRELFTKVLKNTGETEDGVYDWMLLNNGKGWEASSVSRPHSQRRRRLTCLGESAVDIEPARAGPARRVRRPSPSIVWPSPRRQRSREGTCGAPRSPCFSSRRGRRSERRGRDSFWVWGRSAVTSASPTRQQVRRWEDGAEVGWHARRSAQLHGRSARGPASRWLDNWREAAEQPEPASAATSLCKQPEPVRSDRQERKRLWGDGRRRLPGGQQPRAGCRHGRRPRRRAWRRSQRRCRQWAIHRRGARPTEELRCTIGRHDLLPLRMSGRLRYPMPRVRRHAPDHRWLVLVHDFYRPFRRYSRPSPSPFRSPRPRCDQPLCTQPSPSDTHSSNPKILADRFPLHPCLALRPPGPSLSLSSLW